MYKEDAKWIFGKSFRRDGIKKSGRDNLHHEENVVARYVDPNHSVTTHYPFNPNGSAQGVAGVCNNDGRVMIMMPHPERTFLTKQYSWAPDNWDTHSPWFKMFDNAYQFVKKN